MVIFLPFQHILYCIVDSECKSRDVLQSYFDLLGELMKFNIDAFKRFNKYINTDEKVKLKHSVSNKISALYTGQSLTSAWFVFFQVSDIFAPDQQFTS